MKIVIKKASKLSLPRCCFIFSKYVKVAPVVGGVADFLHAGNVRVNILVEKRGNVRIAFSTLTVQKRSGETIDTSTAVYWGQ